jgi:hypothetical protein
VENFKTDRDKHSDKLIDIKDEQLLIDIETLPSKHDVGGIEYDMTTPLRYDTASSFDQRHKQKIGTANQKNTSGNTSNEDDKRPK